MKIIKLVPFYMPARQFGGPVTIVHGFARQMQQMGHEVKVITLDQGVSKDLPRNEWTTFEGIPVWYERTSAINRVPPYVAHSIRQVLRRELADADVLCVHLALAHVCFVGIQEAHRAGVPCVYTPNGSFSSERMSQRRFSKQVYHALFERRALQMTTAFHANTTAERDDLINQGACSERIVIVPNGVDVSHKSPAADREEARAKWTLPKDAVIMLYLGQIVEFKGIDLAIRAFAQVAKEHPRAHFLIVGPDRGFEGTARRLVKDLGIESRVRFAGTADDHMKTQAYAASDFFVLTSHTEGLPMAVLEAAQAGLACLVTQGCRIPEVADNQAGFVVENNVSSITPAMQQLFENDELRETMSKNAVLMVDRHFRLDDVSRRLVSLYESLQTSNKPDSREPS